MTQIEIRSVWCPPQNEEQKADNEIVSEGSIVEFDVSHKQDIFIAELVLHGNESAVGIVVHHLKGPDITPYGPNYTKIEKGREYTLYKPDNTSIIFKSDPDHVRGMRVRMIPQEMGIGVERVPYPSVLETAVTLEPPLG